MLASHAAGCFPCRMNWLILHGWRRRTSPVPAAAGSALCPTSCSCYYWSSGDAADPVAASGWSTSPAAQDVGARATAASAPAPAAVAVPFDSGKAHLSLCVLATGSCQINSQINQPGIINFHGEHLLPLWDDYITLATAPLSGELTYRHVHRSPCWRQPLQQQCPSPHLLCLGWQSQAATAAQCCRAAAASQRCRLAPALTQGAVFLVCSWHGNTLFDAKLRAEVWLDICKASRPCAVTSICSAAVCPCTPWPTHFKRHRLGQTCCRTLPTGEHGQGGAARQSASVTGHAGQGQLGRPLKRTSHHLLPQFMTCSIVSPVSRVSSVAGCAATESSCTHSVQLGPMRVSTHVASCTSRDHQASAIMQHWFYMPP